MLHSFKQYAGMKGQQSHSHSQWLTAHSCILLQQFAPEDKRTAANFDITVFVLESSSIELMLWHGDLKRLLAIVVPLTPLS